MANIQSKEDSTQKMCHTRKQVVHSGHFLRKKEHALASIKLYSQAMAKTQKRQATNPQFKVHGRSSHTTPQSN
jgi:hypothetical protein